MVRTRTDGLLSPDERQEVIHFLSDAHAVGDARLNDHLLLDLTQGPRHGFVAVRADIDGRIVGYAQASTGNEGFVVDAIVALPGEVVPGEPGAEQLRSTLLCNLLEALPAGAAVTWWTRLTDTAAAAAEHLGMTPDRQLLLMQRPLPTDQTAGVTLRPFAVGRDEHEWLQVNNAAFAAHGEQGGWDMPTLQQRLHEAWFDPTGFLLHHRDNRLAAFCWTKMHPGEAPDGGLAGEIYVIAVHPDFHGLGLGRALTVAGLEHMQQHGAVAAMLYVDATNTSAVRLYQSLGFTVTRTEQSYRRSGVPR